MLDLSKREFTKLPGEIDVYIFIMINKDIYQRTRLL